ncbi:MAG: hypothetical protein ABIK32_07920 [Chloroflexota bacterium]|nr:hypothetical protein [Chloroflexota bacterium]
MNNIAYQSYRQPSVEELFLSVEAGSNEQAIELAVPPSTHSSRLYKFYHRLEEKLNDLGSNGFISHVQHSRSRGTTFTVKLVPTKDSEFLEALNNMPEVEEVTEESKGGYAYPGLSHKFNVLLAQ